MELILQVHGMIKSNESDFLTKVTKVLSRNAVLQVCQVRVPSSSVSYALLTTASVAFGKRFLATYENNITSGHS